MEEKNTKNQIILGYRKVIESRYNYENLKSRSGLPKAFNEENLEKVRSYFLDHIYPLPEKREDLNDAFESLEGYIRSPEKLLRILLDSTSLLFKYGRHLPKILKVGLKAMRSFKQATKFENALAQMALNRNMIGPYEKEDMHELIKALPKSELEEFIGSSQDLFETLHDRKLVKKIIDIVHFLIEKMELRPKTYSSTEIDGLRMGKDIIEKGDALFEELSLNDQKQIFTFCSVLEYEMLDNIYGTIN